MREIVPSLSEKVKNSSPKKMSADCRLPPFTKIFCQQSADCRPTVGSMSVICWPSVSWEPLSNTRKASTRREEHCILTRNETFSLESTILFRFFRDQSPLNLLCLGFLGTKPLTSSSQSRSKKFVYSGFLQLFFCFTKSEHYQLIFIIGHWLLKTWWLLKEPFLLQVKLHS